MSLFFPRFKRFFGFEVATGQDDPMKSIGKFRIRCDLCWRFFAGSSRNERVCDHCKPLDWGLRVGGR